MTTQAKREPCPHHPPHGAEGKPITPNDDRFWEALEAMREALEAFEAMREALCDLLQPNVTPLPVRRDAKEWGSK